MKIKPGRLVILCIAMLIAGVSTLFLTDSRLVFCLTEQQLQKKLDAKLPLTKTYLRIFDVTLNNPRVTLTNRSKRVAAGLDIQLTVRVGKSPKKLNGSVDASGEVIYQPNKGEFYLANPVIERLRIQGIPEKYSKKVNFVLTRALEDYYAKHPIYTLNPKKYKQAIAKMVLKEVRVKDSKLHITVEL